MAKIPFVAFSYHCRKKAVGGGTCFVGYSWLKNEHIRRQGKGEENQSLLIVWVPIMRCQQLSAKFGVISII